jgi:hypothetical protein
MKKIKFAVAYSLWDEGDVLTDFKGNGFYKEYESDEFGLSQLYVDKLLACSEVVYF